MLLAVYIYIVVALYQQRLMFRAKAISLSFANISSQSNLPLIKCVAQQSFIMETEFHGNVEF